MIRERRKSSKSISSAELSSAESNENIQALEKASEENMSKSKLKLSKSSSSEKQVFNLNCVTFAFNCALGNSCPNFQMEEFLGSINCRLSYDVALHWNYFNGPLGRNIIDFTCANCCIQRSYCNCSSSIQRTSFEMV